MAKILIIEDDKSIAEIERDYLTASGYEVHVEENGVQGLNEGLKEEYDLVLLDLMLPGADGFFVCEKLREKRDIPILMVTARLEETDKIRGLGLGADDYIEKPFSPRELTARVRANLAQYQRLREGKADVNPVISIGSITCNRDTRAVTAYGEPVPLKNKEYELLLFLMQHPNVIFSRETLYDRVWGLDAYGDSATVAVHINRLREKLERDPQNPEYIQTLRGAGYRFFKGTEE